MPQIPGFPNGKKPKRATRSDRLDAVGLDTVAFELYQKYFIEDRCYIPFSKRDIYADGSSGEWWTVKYPYNDRDILQHLTQEHFVGLRWWKYTRCLAFDIDVHGNAAVEDALKHPARDRLDSIRAAFNGKDPLVIQSSSNGGLHVYYWIEGKTPIRGLKSRVQKLFDYCGIQIGSGWIEHVTGTPKKSFRLPLGLGSNVLDPDDLYPVASSLSGQLDFIDTFIKETSYPLDYLLACTKSSLCISTTNSNCATPGRLESNAIVQLPAPPANCSATTNSTQQTQMNRIDMIYCSKKGQVVEKEVDYMTIARHALKFGITKSGSRLKLINAIVPYCLLNLNLSRNEAKQYIWDWITNQNNGNSQDWNAGKFKQIRREVAYLVNGFIIPIRSVNPFGLTPEDILFIHNSNSKHIEKKWIAQFFRNVKSLLKDSNNGIQISHSMFRKIWNCSIGTASIRVERLKALGILEMVKNYSNQYHEARLWKVNHVTKSDGPYSSFTEGLLDILPKDQLESVYTEKQIRTMRTEVSEQSFAISSPVSPDLKRAA